MKTDSRPLPIQQPSARGDGHSRESVEISRERKTDVDNLPVKVLTLSMDAASGYLFKMPEAASSSGFTGWHDRLAKFNEMSQAYGGLLPRSVLPDALGVTRQSVAIMIDRQVIEVVNYFGVQFVTGRSLAEYRSGEKSKGGRGHKLTRWEKIKVGAGIGSAVAEIVCPE